MNIKHTITDNDLIKELKLRFETNVRMIEDQKNLMMQLKDVNTKLLQSEQLKTNFLSNIRNEINNPITSILELSKNISQANPSMEMIKKFATLIYNEAFSLDFQLRNIFLSAEIEAGESSPAISSINVLAFIKSVLENFQHQMDKKQIKLSVNINVKANQLFYTDPEKLHLILSNLISNAILYSIDEGKINLDCIISDDNALVISIADKGIGISKENENKIFDRFSQLQTGSTKSFLGHGLGLTVTKALLELINGEINLVTEENKGSTFTIKLYPFELSDENDIILSTDGNSFLFNADGAELF